MIMATLVQTLVEGVCISSERFDHKIEPIAMNW